MLSNINLLSNYLPNYWLSFVNVILKCFFFKNRVLFVCLKNGRVSLLSVVFLKVCCPCQFYLWLKTGPFLPAWSPNLKFSCFFLCLTVGSLRTAWNKWSQPWASATYRSTDSHRWLAVSTARDKYPAFCGRAATTSVDIVCFCWKWFLLLVYLYPPPPFPTDNGVLEMNVRLLNVLSVIGSVCPAGFGTFLCILLMQVILKFFMGARGGLDRNFSFIVPYTPGGSLVE